MLTNCLFNCHFLITDNDKRDFKLEANKNLFYEAANHVIIKHKRLFPAISRFRAAAHLIIIRNQQAKFSRQSVLQSKFKKSKNAESISGLTLMAKERIEQSPDIEHWRSLPNPVIEGWTPVIQWCIVAPVHAALFYTIPNCRYKPNYFLLTFVMSISWIAVFSYIMVWMVSHLISSPTFFSITQTDNLEAIEFFVYTQCTLILFYNYAKSCLQFNLGNTDWIYLWYSGQYYGYNLPRSGYVNSRCLCFDSCCKNGNCLLLVFVKISK